MPTAMHPVQVLLNTRNTGNVHVPHILFYSAMIGVSARCNALMQWMLPKDPSSCQNNIPLLIPETHPKTCLIESQKKKRPALLQSAL
jgi:hypothetical protein